MLRVATRIVQRLFDEGFTAYFAGGWVRDYLRGQMTDEIDIATNAPPDQIVKLFSKTVPVGIAFGVVIVVEEEHFFEVTTFRKDLPYYDGRHPSGVDYSTPEKDALRRDFTINGMFYDPLTETLHDFVEGQKDLKGGIIRAIGNPIDRFQEDRLRMIRAIRFACRFDFTIDPETAKAIELYAPSLLPSVSMERIWQEFTKMAKAPRFDQALIEMQRLGLLQVVFPELSFLTPEEIASLVAPFPYYPYPCPPSYFFLPSSPRQPQRWPSNCAII